MSGALLKNPYKPGSVAHQDFDTYCLWYQDTSADRMKELHQELTTQSNDYLRYGWKTMYGFQFHAECVAEIYRQRFGKVIQEHS